MVVLVVTGLPEGGRRKRQLGLLGFGYLGYSGCHGNGDQRFSGDLCKEEQDRRHQDQPSTLPYSR